MYNITNKKVCRLLKMRSLIGDVFLNIQRMANCSNVIFFVVQITSSKTHTYAYMYKYYYYYYYNPGTYTHNMCAYNIEYIGTLLPSYMYIYILFYDYSPYGRIGYTRYTS